MRLHGVMILWLTLLTAGGCSTTTPDPWLGIEVDQAPATQPVDMPAFPQPTNFDEDSVTFDLSGARQLEQFRVAALGNADIAAANADEIDALRRGAAELVQAGRHQRRVADLRAEVLAEERRHWAFERFGYWAIIVALGVSAVD